MKSKVLIFGREPVAYVGLVQVVLALLVSFGWLEFIGLRGQADVGLVVGVLSGIAALYLAFVTNETLLAPAVEAVKALLSLGVIYGLHLTAEETGLLISVVVAVIAFFHRGAVFPVRNPSFDRVPADRGYALP